MALHEIPFGGYRVQELGQARRVVSGEGDFAGQDAYETFKSWPAFTTPGGPGR
jgi:hypothetical protein